jgi:hypothetical protein
MTTTHLTLVEGDSDAELRWGGETATGAEPLHMEALVAPNDDGRTSNTLVQPVPIRQLQRSLIELGFTFVRRATPGVMDRLTKWGVREFQIYARMPVAVHQARAARGTPYVDSLIQVELTHRYAGAVTGDVNDATLRAIQHWRRYSLRCPVVVSAYNVGPAGEPLRPHTENIWLFDDLPNEDVRMFARDFSRYYTLPNRRSEEELIPLGKYQVSPSGRFKGPLTRPPRSCWPEAETLPEHLVGVPLARLTPAQLSTFKAVRALSEVEGYGYLDCINGWDDAYFSLGPCHWTIAMHNGGNVQGGELCGYFAYLKHRDARSYSRAIGYFGIQPSVEWGADGGAIFDRSLRKYNTWLAEPQERGPAKNWERTEADVNYFRGWHWCYRFLMAARTVPGFRHRMWGMTRIRLRDILRAPWTAGSAADARTIGDVFTSERAVAMILRWHVYRPAHMVVRGAAGERLRNAYGHARAAAPRLNWQAAPASWTDAHERALVQGLWTEIRALGDNSLIQTQTQVDRWPSSEAVHRSYRYRLGRTMGRLSDARRSFRLDDSDL